MHTHKKIETLISRPRGLILAASIGLALTTQAQDDWDMGWPFYEPLTQTQKYGISPFYGYRFGGEVQNFETGTTYSFKEGPAYGVFLDYAPMNYYGRYEVLWSHQDSGLDFRGDNGLGDVDVTIDVIQVVRVQCGVLEPPAKVSIAILIEPDGTILHAGIHLDVHPRQWFSMIGIGRYRADLAVILLQLHGQRVGIVRFRFGLTAAADFHEHVAAAQFLG